MIKNSFILITTVALVLISCNATDEKVDDSSVQKEDSNYQPYTSTLSEIDELKETNEKAIEVKDTSSLLGYYVGSFDAIKYKVKKSPMFYNRINISIDSIKNNLVFGHSVVAGNIRPFAGRIISTEKDYINLQFSEPGNNKYDGAFIAKLYPIQKKLIGSWESFDTTLAVSKRKFELSLQTFSYQPNLTLGDGTYQEAYNSYDEATGKYEAITNDAAKFNASVVELKASDIENIYKTDLEIIRNAIYARHGYSFKNRKMRYFFDNSIDWYIPVSINVSNELTELEKKNIDLLKRYEDHATVYYDKFGR